MSTSGARFAAVVAIHMLITDLPRHQRLAEALTVELRIGARSRQRSHVDDEIDARFLEKIGEFDDRSSGMTYREEDVRVGSDGTMAPSRRAATAQIYD